MNDVKGSSLGKAVSYKGEYDASLLYPILREQNRAKIGVTAGLPFVGEDLWTGYELSWLDKNGKPQVAIGEFRIPVSSPNIVESKSFKLYLNSFNQSRFGHWEEVRGIMEEDLSKEAGVAISVRLYDCESFSALTNQDSLQAWTCIDGLEAQDYVYEPSGSLLQLGNDNQVQERLFSRLLRSNCPVTGQPDWADLYIQYSGPEIDKTSLLRYVVSFRQCQDFHEHCVERIYMDLLRICKPSSLAVYARYTRRGGLDINPYRSTPDLGGRALSWRTPRQ